MKYRLFLLAYLIFPYVIFGQNFNEWKQQAEMGDSEAMYQLGILYHLGDSISQNYNEAVNWYKKSIEKGNLNSLPNLAICYLMGTGVPTDTVYAMQLLHQATFQKSTTAMSLLATIFRNEGSYQNLDSCFYWEKNAAELGDAGSQYMLSIYYKQGIGVKQDDRKAFEWRLKAAEVGDGQAIEGIAIFYRDGIGVEQDFRQMFIWLEKAIEKGRYNALVYLGTLHQKGMYGLPINKSKAFEMFQEAARHGNTWGELELGECYRYARGVPQNKELARYWIQKAAEQGWEPAVEAWQEIDTGIEVNELRKKNEEYKQWFNTNR